MPWPNNLAKCSLCFSLVSLPDWLISMSLGKFAPPVSVFVFFVVHISFSRIHTLLYALTNLPSKFGDYSYDSLTFIPVFIFSTLADFFASKRNRPTPLV